MTMQGEPSDLRVGPQTEELETAEEETEEAPLNPVEERLARYESTLAQLSTATQTMQNQLGYIGRQLTGLTSQPRAAETNQQVIQRTEQIEKLLLRGMDDETRATYLEEQLVAERNKPAPKEATPARSPEPQDQGPSVLQIESNQAWAELADYAAEINLPYELARARLLPLVEGEQLTRSESTAADPHGWRSFVKEAKKLMREQKSLQRAEGARRGAIDTSRSAGTRENTKQDLVNRYARGEEMTSSERIAAVKAFKEEGVYPKAPRP